MGKNEPIKPSTKSAAPTAPAVAAKPPKAPAAVVKPVKKAKLPLKQRVEVKCTYYTKRLARFGRVILSLKHEATRAGGAYIETAVEALESAQAEFAKLPDDFSRSAARVELDVGATVSIRDKRRALYAGVLGTDEMDGLTVIKIVNGGKTVLCTTPEGVRQMFPAIHLRMTAGAEE